MLHPEMVDAIQKKQPPRDLIPEDLRQAAIVVATMLYNVALREEMLPRPPQPR